VGVVASAAFLAPSAVAVGPVANERAAVKIVTKPTLPKHRVSSRDYGRVRDHGCYYPPNSSYNVVIKGVEGRRSVSIFGSAKVGRCGFAGKTVYLYQVRHGSKGDVIGHGDTDDHGSFTIHIDLHRQGRDDKVQVVAVVKRDGDIRGGRSEVFKIEGRKYF
jgi:hypothetical protein